MAGVAVTVFGAGLDVAFLSVVFTGVLAVLTDLVAFDEFVFFGAVAFFSTGVFFVSVFVVLFFVFLSVSSVGAPPALAFHPKRFNLPTMAFLDMPRRLPISDVESPLPVKDFNFFNAILSQPLLILQNPCYSL